jgi:hypothetical protein
MGNTKHLERTKRVAEQMKNQGAELQTHMNSRTQGVFDDNIHLWLDGNSPSKKTKRNFRR